MGRWCGVTLGVLLAPGLCLGGEEARFDAVVMGMGGAGRAAVGLMAAVELNPAALISERRYAVMGSLGAEGDLGGGGWRLGAVDSVTSEGVAAAFSIDQVWVPGEAIEPGWVEVGGDAEAEAALDRTRTLDLALAVPTGVEGLGLGASAKLLRYDAASGEVHREVSAELGAFYRPQEAWAAALVVNNVVPTGDPLQPTSVVVAGALYPMRGLLVAADVGLDLTSLDHPSAALNLGGVYLLSDAVPVRVGYLRAPEVDAGGAHRLCGGVGVGSAGASLDYGVQWRIDGEGRRAGDTWYHLLSATIAFGGAAQ